MSMIDILKARRSIYVFGKNIKMSEESFKKLIEDTLELTPSAFNSHTQRIVILFDTKHELFWEEVKQKLLPLTNNKERTSAKIESFKQAYATILFYDETQTTLDLEKAYPLYAKNFELWAIEQNAMLQINVWNVLTDHHLGASLQHYNEVIEERTSELFDIPKTWKLIGQMPVGEILETPQAKDHGDTEHRIKYFN